MLRPILSQIKREDQSTYSFVYAVAKRAREIAEELENDPEHADVEKPVDIAVQEFATGKVKMGNVVTIDEKKAYDDAAAVSTSLDVDDEEE